MSIKSFLTPGICAALFALAGCSPPVPPDYSADYSYVPVVYPNGKQRMVMVPNACLTPDPTGPTRYLGEHLPPGCANAYNLQRMVEREGDLVQGRKLGPAPAAPSARAAQRYINGGSQSAVYGPTGPLGGGLGRDGGGIANHQGDEERPTAPGFGSGDGTGSGATR